MDQEGNRIGQLAGGRYRVEALLAHGGMGSVYKVRDEREQRALALKRMKPVVGQRAALCRSLFEREYHTLCELKHPRIVEVFDYGIDEQGPFYTMELLDGQDLRACGKLPWQKACEVICDVASALAMVHSRRLLHGDVTPRNVRYTGLGRVKLLDFGAMSPMGDIREVLGTPPFLAPELVLEQSLDARADLFSLGALAYSVLTGVHAYPARTIGEVIDVWRSSPRPPHKLEPDIPEALSQLILELLHRDRAVRPSHAGIVIERVCAISGTAIDERAEVVQAYLSVPHLVGQQQRLAEVRAQLGEVVSGSAATLIVLGVRGSGRSRLLDECVLEAKLLGIRVLRANANDGRESPYGVALSLCDRLRKQLPALSGPLFEVHWQALAWLLPGDDERTRTSLPPRARALSALCDLFLAATRAGPIMLAIDDADAIDEPSLAFLASLARKAGRRPLAIVVTCASAASAEDSALSILREQASTLYLEPLTLPQTEELLGSVFGQTDHVLPLARQVHERSLGNPRTVLELVQHLVATGVARYEAGSWSLPEFVERGTLPATLTEAFRRHMASIDADALELARTLSLLDPALLTMDKYVSLTSHGGAARTHRALDRLVAHGVLSRAGDHYRFVDDGWAALLRADLSETERRALHTRIADLIDGALRPVALAHHLFEAGRLQHAVEALLSYVNESRGGAAEYTNFTLRLLERALASRDALRISGADYRTLQYALVAMAQILADPGCFKRHALPLLGQLERDAGLADYQALSATLPPEQRLRDACRRVYERNLVLPEAERGPDLGEALRLFLQMCGNFAGMAATQSELELCEQVPDLEPFFVLSPAVKAIADLVRSTAHVVAGRTEQGIESYTNLLSDMAKPDRAGLIPSAHKAIRLAVTSIVGLMEARFGREQALLRAAELEAEAGHRTNAERLRMAFHLMRCNADAAEACRRRAELLRLQEADGQRYPGSTLNTEALAYFLADDLLGMKRAAERASASAKTRPSLKIIEHFCRCQYHRIQGDYTRALDILQPVLATIAPGRHLMWCWVAAAHVQLLTLLRKPAQAVEVGFEYVAACRREQLGLGELVVSPWVAQALSEAGRLPEAVAEVERCIALAQTRGARGLVLGTLYEQRARIALAQADGAAFHVWSKCFASECSPMHSPPLRAKYERLLQSAREAGIVVEDDRHPNTDERSTLPGALDPVRDQLARCASTESRARCVLTTLLEHSHAKIGYLFGVRAGALVFLNGSPENSPPQGLECWLGERVKSVACATDRTLTLAISAVDHVFSEAGFRDAQGNALLPLVLCSDRDGQTVIAAAVALASPPGTSLIASKDLLDLLCAALLDRGDVDPLTCMASPVS